MSSNNKLNVTSSITVHIVNDLHCKTSNQLSCLMKGGPEALNSQLDYRGNAGDFGSETLEQHNKPMNYEITEYITEQ